MKNCKHCKHWDEDLWRSNGLKNEEVRRCNKIGMYWDQTEWESYDDQIEDVGRVLKPEYKDNKAWAQDGSDYSAYLITQSNFSCNMFETKVVDKKLLVAKIIHDSLMKYNCEETVLIGEKMIMFLESNDFKYVDFYQHVSNNEEYREKKMVRSYKHSFVERIKGELRRYKNQLR